MYLEQQFIFNNNFFYFIMNGIRDNNGKYFTLFFLHQIKRDDLVAVE